MMKKFFSIFLVVILSLATGGYVHAEGKNYYDKKLGVHLKQKTGLIGKKNIKSYATTNDRGFVEKDFTYVKNGAYVGTLESSFGTGEKIQYLGITEKNKEDMAVKIKVVPDNPTKKDKYVDVNFFSNIGGEIIDDGYIDFDLDKDGQELTVQPIPKFFYSSQRYVYMAVGIYNEVDADNYSDLILFKVDNPYYLKAPIVNPVSDKDTVITGTTREDTYVVVADNDEDYYTIGETYVEAGQTKFSVKIPAQKAGKKLFIYAVSGDEILISDDTIVTVLDKTAPAKPTVNMVFDKDTIVTGTAEANSTVSVKVGTSVKGSAKADAKGKYSVKIAAQKGGTTLTINAQDAAKNVSVSQTIKVINTAITVKTVKVTDMKKYDGGKNQLTFINGKGYSQFFYENTSGNYQFVPSSWLKAAGLTVEVKIVNGKKFLFINNPYLSSTPGKVTAPPTMPSIAVKTTKVTDMKKYDGGSNSLTFINGKAYSQFFYENNSGNYQFVPSSWLKAAGLTVEVKKTGSVKRLYITNPYKK